MKRATISVLTLIVMAGLIGCAHHQRLPASCVGGDCAVTPTGCGPAAPAGACDPNQQNCQSCESPPDDCAVPAKKCHFPLLAGLCHKESCVPCEQPVAEAGPPAGAITYPYYTVRGPRDYLAKNPGSIGP
jgi:hypothetical protein